MEFCINSKCGKKPYPGRKYCSVDCARIVQGLPPIKNSPAAEAKLARAISRPAEPKSVPAPKREGTTALDGELALRRDGFSTLPELAREFGYSKQGLYIALQREKVAKRTVQGIRSVFYSVADTAAKIGRKGEKKEAPAAAAPDFEKDAAELDAALVAAGRADLAESAARGGVKIHTNVHTRPRRAPKKISGDLKVRPLTRLLARQALICERSGLHEAERVLLWMTLKSAGLLKGATALPI